MEDPVIMIRKVGAFEQGVTYEKGAVLKYLESVDKDFGDCPYVQNTSVVEAVVDFLASMIATEAKCPISQRRISTIWPFPFSAKYHWMHRFPFYYRTKQGGSLGGKMIVMP